MQRVCLNGKWRFRESGSEEWLPASVPGGVYSDLLAAGEIGDPYDADNELDCQWVGETDWEYRRTVEIPESMLVHDRIVLACEGLDTVTTVSVNGARVGSSANMHRAYEFDVADALVAGENEVAVEFRSPVAYAIERRDAHEYDVPALRYPVDQPARNFVRKAQCHYGWDWGPCLPTMGVWRDISILGHSTPVIEHVRTEQEHMEGGVSLTTHVGVRTPTATTATVSMAVAETETEHEVELGAGLSEVSLSTTVDAPRLWWPNGHGDQALYDLDVAVTAGGETHRNTERIGFREVELVREADGDGESFGFEVNGEPVFAKGANWIPTDALYARAGERRDELLRDAVAANMNMLRIWGGGYYEHDAFYDKCDELGVLVWQDFMFACALYPADDGFLDSVRAEARYQVRRLNTHPALALWCGNNENEEAVVNWFADEDHIDRLRADYDALYLDTIGPVVKAEDPDTAYWPASPSSGSDAPEPYEMNRGDVHYWDVWHEGAPFSEYETIEPRFVSEFGYQSFPSVETISTVVPEEQRNPTAPLMEHHQRHADGNRVILQQMADSFRVPFSFADFTYLSQIQQGLAMKTAIEHFRRLRPYCMGALYWQLHDLWPCASWSSVDYGGNWKALQYLARRFYAPVLVSLTTSNGDDTVGDVSGKTLDGVSMTATDGDDETTGDVGRTTAGTETTDDGPVEVWITNDTAARLDGDLTVAVVPFDGGSRITETRAVDLPAYGSEVVTTVDPDDADPARTMVTARYAGAEESYPAFQFAEAYKRLDLPEANIQTEVEGSSVTVRTDAAALFVALDAGLDGDFSDNYFHLAPGDERTVTFDGDATGPALESALTLTHLRETY